MGECWSNAPAPSFAKRQEVETSDWAAKENEMDRLGRADWRRLMSSFMEGRRDISNGLEGWGAWVLPREFRRDMHCVSWEMKQMESGRM